MGKLVRDFTRIFACMYILAPSPEKLHRSAAVNTAVKSIKYAQRKWYEVMGDIKTYLEACKRAEVYYKYFAAIGGIPLVIEKRTGYGVFVDASGLQEDVSIEEHARQVQTFQSPKSVFLKRYVPKQRSQFHYPLNIRE